MIIVRLFAVVFILLLCQGCGPKNDIQSDIPVLTLEPGDVELISSERFSLIRDVQFHDSLFIEELSAVSVDKEGNVYVAAERHNIRSVYQFSGEGELLDTLGRKGENSGEFEGILNIQIREDTLYVFDDELSRVSLFDTQTNRYLNNVEFGNAVIQNRDDSVVYHPVPVQIWLNEHFLVEFTDSLNPAIISERAQFYRLGDRNGDVAESNLFELRPEEFLIGDHAGRPASFQLPYPEKSLMTEFRNGVFYSSWTEKFEIFEHDSTGSEIRKIAYPYKRAILDSEKLVSEEFSHNRQLQLTRQSAEYPSEWPALHSMLLDDAGRLWVALIPDNESEFEWWIIDPSDETDPVKQIFHWPRNSQFLRISNGSVFAAEPDRDGFKKVVKYIIQED